MKYNQIMLIDDDEDDQEIFLEALLAGEVPAPCITFSNAQDALNQLTLKNIQPDIIFLDLNMPIMNGQQFLVAIKKNEVLKIIPIIIFTTSSHQATKDTMMALGAQDFITKPAKFAELVKILQRTII